MLSYLWKYKKHSLGLLLLIAIEVGLVGCIGIWREYFWESLSKVQLNAFLICIGIFSGIALTASLVSGLRKYLVSTLGLQVRTELTNKYMSGTRDMTTEGEEQRVQMDCADYPQLWLSLCSDLILSAMSCVVYVILIVYQLSAIYLLIPLLYVAIGTSISGWIAKPLIYFNYLIQKLEASFRRKLLQKLQVHELNLAFNKIINLKNKIINTTKRLNYFQSFYNQLVVVMPYLLFAPIYFSGIIVFGVFMQVARAVEELVSSMSCIINSFGDINNWLSCRKRLKEIKLI